jgi:hypothetical protein
LSRETNGTAIDTAIMPQSAARGNCKS